jgi:hypothetical protein
MSPTLGLHTRKQCRVAAWAMDSEFQICHLLTVHSLSINVFGLMEQLKWYSTCLASMRPRVKTSGLKKKKKKTKTDKPKN